MTGPADIVLVRERLPAPELARLVERFFGDMVKYVVDLERGVAAVGGELHADAEALLLEDGSRQEDLWGANYWPGLGPRAASSSPRRSTSAPRSTTPGWRSRAAPCGTGSGP